MDKLKYDAVPNKSSGNLGQKTRELNIFENGRSPQAMFGSLFSCFYLDHTMGDFPPGTTRKDIDTWRQAHFKEAGSLIQSDPELGRKLIEEATRQRVQALNEFTTTRVDASLAFNKGLPDHIQDSSDLERYAHDGLSQLNWDIDKAAMRLAACCSVESFCLGVVTANQER